MIRCPVHGLQAPCNFVGGCSICKVNLEEAETFMKKETGTKFDEGKPILALIAPAGIEAEGQAMTHGRHKYGMHNFREGLPIIRLLSAALRHIFAFLRGNNIDGDSGVHHLGLAKAELGMALQMLEDHPEMDDRYKKE